MPESIEFLVETLYSLREPWRGRFLSLVANWATGGTWNGRQPKPEEVAAWLQADLRLYREVRSLLHAWQGPAG